jgi:uncharacterized protein (TIGR03118 family)
MNRSLLKLAGFVLVAALGTGAHAGTPGQRVRQANHVSGGLSRPSATHLDPHLVNAWGMVMADGLLWVADNGKGKATVYETDGDRFPHSSPIVIDVHGHGVTNGAPTGIVHNAFGGFHVQHDGIRLPSRFLFAGEDGTVAGWNPFVDPDDAHVVLDHANHAVYKGLTIAADGLHRRLYLANFGVHDAGEIEVYDVGFHPIGHFTDPDPPAMPSAAGPGAVWTPFNVTAIDGDLVVAFAAKIPGHAEEQHCAGCGFISVFSPDGTRLAQAHGNVFDAPWGVSLAPALFGRFSGALLVGNFGSGKIDALDRQTLRYIGRLQNEDGHDLVIDGLWGITRGKTFGSLDDLFFAAGPNGEDDGLMGKLEPIH